MHVTIRARLSFDKGTLLLEQAGGDLRRFLDGGIWRRDERVGAWRCEAMHYARVRQDLAAAMGADLRDEVPQPARVFWPKVALPSPRPEQQEALAAWRQAGRRGQVIMPTGTGKTEVALAAMAEVAQATLVIAPVRDLMYQWHRRILRGLGCDAGILGDGRHNLRPVTVTTYDSAYIHVADIGARFALLIFDEEHHLPGPSYREAAILSTAPLRLGLTATPQRSDGREADLDWLVGPVAYRMPFRQARVASLADFDVVRIPVALSDDEQLAYDRYGRQIRQFMLARRKERPGYTWQDLCTESGRDPAARLALRAFYLKQSIEDRAGEKLRVLEDLFRLHAGQRVIVFAGSNAMAMEVSRRFLVPTILSHTAKRERLEVLEGFAAGRLPVLVANRVLDEGIDVPEAKAAVVIGGQASTRQAQQRLGRILRRTGQARAVLYEIVCGETREVERSRTRRQSDAYERTSHRRL